jgi:metal-dependent hydrolase (beta-lactamase superfamily II)
LPPTLHEVRQILVDFGYDPVTLLNNMEILKISPEKLDSLVLSHGHYDHFGLVGFLSAAKGKFKPRLPFFIGGEAVFAHASIPMAASTAHSTGKRSLMQICCS